MSQRRWCPRSLGASYYQAITIRGLWGKKLGLRMLVLLPSPRRSPICSDIPNPLRLVRREGGKYRSEYALAFPETAWDMGYLTYLRFHPHLSKLTRTERTLKARGETILDNVVFWFNRVDRQVRTR